MNTKSIVITIVVIILAGFAIWFLVGVSETNTKQIGTTPERNDLGATTTQETIINYTDNGFSPTPVTVKLGDTVTFINESTNPMWVASGPHPTHTNYPAFDQLTSVDAGGVYKFTFDKVGTWTYHNHITPTKTGTIEVTK
ncbi:MAG: hypothetical protein WC757_00455 [Candidatus Paceibacterota bacterium]|jgi:plastocyanin